MDWGAVMIGVAIGAVASSFLIALAAAIFREQER